MKSRRQGMFQTAVSGSSSHDTIQALASDILSKVPVEFNLAEVQVGSEDTQIEHVLTEDV
jgi:hypothetical protein